MSLVLSDWSPYKKRLGHTETSGVSSQRKDHVKRQREDGRLQAKERGLRETNPADTLILDLQPKNGEEINVC